VAALVFKTKQALSYVPRKDYLLPFFLQSLNQYLSTFLWIWCSID